MHKGNKKRKVVPIRSAQVAEPRGPAVGRIILSGPDGVTVDFPGNPHGPIRARSVVGVPELTAACEAHPNPEVMLLFEGDRSDRPVILGLFAPPSEPGLVPEKQEVLSASIEGTDEQREARVDGRRVVLEAKDEIVLRCGKAVIEMRSDGRVVVRGTHVETDSDGLNRIKGSMVLVN